MLTPNLMQNGRGKRAYDRQIINNMIGGKLSLNAEVRKARI